MGRDFYLRLSPNHYFLHSLCIHVRLALDKFYVCNFPKRKGLIQFPSTMFRLGSDCSKNDKISQGVLINCRNNALWELAREREIT